MAVFDAVFEGGGAKGIAFAGALEVFHAGGHRFRRVLGTSAGAISAALVAAGYTPSEMLDAVRERLPDGKPRFTSFMDAPERGDIEQATLDQSILLDVLRGIDLPWVPETVERKFGALVVDGLLANKLYAQMFLMVERGGLFAGKRFLQWLAEKLGVKGIGAADSLKAFHEKTGSDLTVIASDTSDVEMLVLNHRTAPELPVTWAVRMSMSIPFVWQEVVWREKWGLYRARRKTGNTIVDGGALSNFPIRLIASDDPAVAELMGGTKASDALNLGLMIDERVPVPGAPDTDKTPPPVTQLRTVRRVGRLIDTMMGAWDNEMVRAYESDICRLPAKGYGTLEFDMSGDRLAKFLDAARDAMRKHLAART